MGLLHWTYALPVVLGLTVLFVFPLTRHMARQQDRQRYWVLQGLTCLGAIVGAKLAVLYGDFGWPWADIPGGWRTAMESGRSIVGGLLGGLAFAEAGKPLLDYQLPPNDRFAAVLPFSIAIGRVGCTLSGCCYGLPHQGWFAMVDAAGVARWPTQLMDLVFQLVTGTVFIFIIRVRVAALAGRLFALYLVLYGLFRFASEFIRDTPRLYGSWSGYQVLSVLLVLVGCAMLAFRRVPKPVLEASHA